VFAPQIKLAKRLKNSLANIWILYFNLRMAYITPQKSQGRKRGDKVILCRTARSVNLVDEGNKSQPRS